MIACAIYARNRRTTLARRPYSEVMEGRLRDPVYAGAPEFVVRDSLIDLEIAIALRFRRNADGASKSR